MAENLELNHDFPIKKLIDFFLNFKSKYSL